LAPHAELDPNQPLVLAGRAVVHFEANRPLDAVLDADSSLREARLTLSKSTAAPETWLSSDRYRPNA